MVARRTDPGLPRSATARVAGTEAVLYRRLLKHGIFTSEQHLAQQMLALVETYEQTAKPFAWTYTGKTLNA